jgi:hypothetical protein
MVRRKGLKSTCTARNQLGQSIEACTLSQGRVVCAMRSAGGEHPPTAFAQAAKNGAIGDRRARHRET